jgi:hypothetical protein
VLPIVLEMLNSDAAVRHKCSKLLRIVSNGTPQVWCCNLQFSFNFSCLFLLQQASYLVLTCDVIKRLCDSLVHFKGCNKKWMVFETRFI